jgi:hypothetical protein
MRIDLFRFNYKIFFMKRIILLSIAVLAFISMTYAQNNVTLKINHKLGEDEFALNQAAKNNMDHDFNVTRLEYYISEISLIHDGGDETLIEDYWALVNASKSSVSELSLGDYDITNVEKLVLHIGVDPEHNHLDPSSWGANHPLSPKSPSMHWGWSAGYRFVAFEGYGGSAFNQLFQLHGLGDSNYFTTEVELDIMAENNLIEINIDADYTKALENIGVNTGVIVHGDYGAAKECLNNFGRLVFSPSSITSSTIDFSEVSEFGIYPNPITDGFSTIKLELQEAGAEYDLSVTSIDGKQLQYLQNVSNNQNLNFSNQSSGMYFVNLIKEGHTIITKKVFVN